MKLCHRFTLRQGVAPVLLMASAALLLGACTSMNSSTSATAATTPSTSATLSAQSIAAIIDSPDRSAADRNNDIRRKPAQMLAFIGIRPGIVAFDVSSGGGYTTELLARAVGPTGRVYGQNPPRDTANAPPPPAMPEGNSSGMAAAQPGAMSAPMSMPMPATPRQTLMTRASSPIPGAGNIIAVSRKFEAPFPPEVANNALDLVTLMFNYHDLGHMGVNRAAMNQAVFAALKPGGMYVIADHSGRPGTGISEAGTLHRIEQTFLQQEVEAAGFKLATEGNFMRNPSDPRDKNTPEPLQLKDEFVLKFVKP